MTQCAFAKILSKNDASQVNHQAGPLIPIVLETFFPELDKAERNPRATLELELWDGEKPLGSVDSSYIWYTSKTEYHLTNLRPIIPLWTEGDAIRFERTGHASYRLGLVRQGSELWHDINEQTTHPGRCGILSGDIGDFERFGKALDAAAKRAKKRRTHRIFDPERCQREADERLKRRKRALSTHTLDPDKTEKRAAYHNLCLSRLAKLKNFRDPSRCELTESDIDLMADFTEGDIVIIEVKTLRGDERAQFDNAIGKLARYRHEVLEERVSAGKATKIVHKVICTDRRPSEFWIKLANREGIGLIWIPEKTSSKKTEAQKDAEKPGATRTFRQIIATASGA